MGRLKDFYISNSDYKDVRADNKVDPYAVKKKKKKGKKK